MNAISTVWLHFSAWLLAVLPLPLIARIFLVGMFPFSALDKLLHWRDARQQASSSFLPAAWAPALLVLGMAIEVIAPACIVVGGAAAAPAAFLLSGYCVVTALLFHPFWRVGDFWKQDGGSVDRTHFWDFTKNFGLAGGLLLVAAGRGL